MRYASVTVFSMATHAADPERCLEPMHFEKFARTVPRDAAGCRFARQHRNPAFMPVGTYGSVKASDRWTYWPRAPKSALATLPSLPASRLEVIAHAEGLAPFTGWSSPS